MVTAAVRGKDKSCQLSQLALMAKMSNCAASRPLHMSLYLLLLFVCCNFGQSFGTFIPPAPFLSASDALLHLWPYNLFLSVKCRSPVMGRLNVQEVTGERRSHMESNSCGFLLHNKV